MAQYRDSKVAMVLLYFVAGFAGTACLLLLASNPIRCVLEYRVLDLTVALVLALLSGLGAALLALLPDETRRLAVSLYSGVVLALVGFIVLVWFLPSPPVGRCSVLGSSAAAAKPTATRTPIPTPLTFHSVIPVPGSTFPASPDVPAPCVPPPGWTMYHVRHGDTLSFLARRTATSQERLMAANCLASSVIHVGQLIRVPRQPIAEEREANEVCDLPSGWVPYFVQTGDTLYRLAAGGGVTVNTLMRANCLASSVLQAGQRIYLPMSAIGDDRATGEVCAPPSHWHRYYVRPGDTLFQLAVGVGATVDTLMRANCLESSTLSVGTMLWVPRSPTLSTRVPPPSTPLPSPSPTRTP